MLLNNKIMVVKRLILDLPLKGFWKDEKLYKIILKNFVFLPRKQLEQDSSYKQIIPYTIIVNPQKEIFLYQRFPTQREERLHNKYSIGIGGHIELVDFKRIEEIITSAAIRELKEEINLKEPLQLKLQGFINDDTNPVGQVHLGVVYQGEVKEKITVKEKKLMKGSFCPIEKLLSIYPLMETWSQILMDSLYSVPEVGKKNF